jgi:uncharacterized membrane protein YcaP (DUF421 family)
MESVIRGGIVYLFLLLVFRIAGKRTLSETTNFDLVLLLIISETTQQAMVDEDHSLMNGALLILTLVAANIGLSLFKQWVPAAERWLEGAPLVVARDGKLLHDRMDRERIDEEDLLEAARLEQGVESLAQVKLAVLERDGKVSIVPNQAPA